MKEKRARRREDRRRTYGRRSTLEEVAMYCAHCGAEIKGNEHFCPDCGAKLSGDTARTATDIVMEKGVSAPETGTDVRPDAPARTRRTRKRAERTEKPKKEYKRTSVPLKVLTVFLIIAALLTGLAAVTVVSLRIGLTGNNVRSAYRDGKLSEFALNTESGRKKLDTIIMNGIVDAETGQPAELNKSQIRNILDKTYVNKFVEDFLADYAGFLIFGRTTANPAVDGICAFLARVSVDLQYETGYMIPDSEIENVRERITDGDLSYLNAGAEQGNAKAGGFDLDIVPSLCSARAALAYAAISAVLLILVFVFNRKNLPAAFGYGGKAMTLTGAAGLILAVSALIRGAAKKTFFFSKAMSYVAMSMGTVCLTVLAAGMILLLIGGILKKHSVILDDEK